MNMKVVEDFFIRKKDELGVQLNEVQLQAVRQTEGPLLLLASPGSGKTTTVIMRIGYLIEEKRINPARIKAITFSRTAANDMRERFKRFFPDVQPVDFSTIHSLAFKVVRESFRKKRTAYQIIEGDIDKEKDAFNSQQPLLHKKIILRNLFNTIVGENITDDQLDELTTYISYIKNKMLSADQYSQMNMNVPKAVQIFKEYESFKKTGAGKLLLDYDDMLVLANEMLEKDQELLHNYQQSYDYVLTDESQDTSLVQHAIIEKLVKRHQNLCVVADDDQAIYSWRGAEPSYLLNFKQVYPDANILYMEQNYRSSKEIVTVANQFIKRNKQRYDKNMFTENAADTSIQLTSLPDYQFQAKYLVRAIADSENFADVAILYRNNASSIALMNEFDRAGIPFYMKDVDNRFFSHWVVQDILNFMRMAFTDKRFDILEKIHMKFNGYISKKQMEALKRIHNHESVFDNLLQYVPLQPYQVKNLKNCKKTLKQMKDMRPKHAIHVIREQLGYEKALEKMCERLGFRREYLIGILNTLEEIADTLETLEDFANLKYLATVLKTAKRRKGQNAVTFSTFHSAKGLEFEKVYMIDLIEGMIPSTDETKNEKEEKDMLEEAVRLFYVGMTRAKTYLELISYEARDGKKAVESQFVTAVKQIMSPNKMAIENKEVTNGKKVVRYGKKASNIQFNPNAVQDRTKLMVGNLIKHRVFGHGEIVKCDGDTIEIRFQAKMKILSITTCIEMGLLEPLT